MKGMPRSLSRAAAAVSAVRRLKVKVENLALSNVGATGVGFGAAVPADLPEGNILFLGAVSYLQFSKNGDADVQDAFDGDYAIGTTPTADATLSGTDANIIPSTALGAATAGLSPVVRGASTTAAIFDNTDESLEININLLVDDANISGTGSMLANGYIDILYAVMGDD
jgi:hypothetical protein